MEHVKKRTWRGCSCADITEAEVCDVVAQLLWEGYHPHTQPEAFEVAYYAHVAVLHEKKTGQPLKRQCRGCRPLMRCIACKLCTCTTCRST